MCMYVFMYVRITKLLSEMNPFQSMKFTFFQDYSRSTTEDFQAYKNNDIKGIV